MYNNGGKLSFNFEGLKYEKYMKCSKNELAKYIVGINEDVKEYRSRIRLLQSKLAKLRGKL